MKFVSTQVITATVNPVTTSSDPCFDPFGCHHESAAFEYLLSSCVDVDETALSAPGSRGSTGCHPPDLPANFASEKVRQRDSTDLAGEERARDLRNPLGYAYAQLRRWGERVRLDLLDEEREVSEVEALIA